ncbi:MAG: membrane-bound lytic murein transglycosylase D [Gammaproteobacteria bacterium]|jgi:membrane-bound lytic murein transglycosylase D
MHSQRIIRLEALASILLLLTACSLSDVREASHSSRPLDNRQAPDRVDRVDPVGLSDAEHRAIDPAVVSMPIPVARIDMWQHIAAGFTWDASDSPHVQSELDLFGENPREIERASRNAEPYLWFIAESLKQRNLPFELALLPLIESGYRANATSPIGAAGLWQFMPRTGERFGLKQSRWFDGRSDIVASTNAALDYLSQLHSAFDDDWLLALAAYNCGQATVQRAVAKTASRDFWTIAPELPLGTRRHVAKLLAAVAVIRNPSIYDTALHPIENSQYFAEIDLGGPLDISIMVSDGTWSEQSFKQLNPAFNTHYTDPNGPFKILAPRELRAPLVERLASIPPADRHPIRTHRVVANDSLSELASRYGVSIKTIKARNKLRGNLIRVGKELLIMGPLTAKLHPGKPLVAKPNAYVVQDGDSFWTIGQQHGLSPTALARLNRIPAQRPLQIGQVLKIVARSDISEYEVAPGDSLWTIARKFNVAIEQLKVWNSLSGRKALQPGQSLVVSGPVRDRT